MKREEMRARQKLFCEDIQFVSGDEMSVTVAVAVALAETHMARFKFYMRVT